MVRTSATPAFRLAGAVVGASATERRIGLRLSLDSQAELSAIRAVKAGDPEAFRPIVEAYKDRIYALAWRLLCDRNEAEDVVQDALLRAFAAIARFDESQPLSHWLLRITSNLCINRLRKKRPMPMEITPEAEPRGLRASSPTTDDPLEYQQLVEGLTEELARLPEHQRTAFVLFHQEELPYAEISEMLGRPVGTIKSDLHRARQQLIARLRKRAVL